MWIEPKVVERIGAHVYERKFFFLRLIGFQFHIVGRPFLRNSHSSHFLEYRLSEKHHVGKYRLVGGIVSELLIL